MFCSLEWPRDNLLPFSWSQWCKFLIDILWHLKKMCHSTYCNVLYCHFFPCHPHTVEKWYRHIIRKNVAARRKQHKINTTMVMLKQVASRLKVCLFSNWTPLMHYLFISPTPKNSMTLPSTYFPAHRQQQNLTIIWVKK